MGREITRRSCPILRLVGAHRIGLPAGKFVGSVPFRRRYALMRNQSLTITVLTVGLVVAGCRQQSNTTPAGTSILQPALAAWQQGDRVGAVSNFVAADWSVGQLFAPDSILSLTETQFHAQVRGGVTKIGNIQAKSDQMIKELQTMKELTAAVAQAGRDAVATNDVALARRHFSSLHQFGTALDSSNSLAILRLDAQAIKRKAEKELATLPQ